MQLVCAKQSSFWIVNGKNYWGKISSRTKTTNSIPRWVLNVLINPSKIHCVQLFFDVFYCSIGGLITAWNREKKAATSDLWDFFPDHSRILWIHQGNILSLCYATNILLSPAPSLYNSVLHDITCKTKHRLWIYKVAIAFHIALLLYSL